MIVVQRGEVLAIESDPVPGGQEAASIGLKRVREGLIFVGKPTKQRVGTTCIFSDFTSFLPRYSDWRELDQGTIGIDLFLHRKLFAENGQGELL